MFNSQHILYMVFATILSIVGLILCRKYVKQDKSKKLVLKIFAILTVIIHYSILYVDFFSTGVAEAEPPLLLPIYPCNVMMWLLLICAFIKNDKSKFAKALYEFTFYAGIICGSIGILLNENFASNPSLLHWYSLRGLLSHSTMVFGCLYILVGGFIRIDVSNCLSSVFGLCLFLVDGFIINSLYLIFGLGQCNSMFLQKVPFEACPWLNTYVMGLMGLMLVFVFTCICEHFTKQKQDRFLYKLGLKLSKKSENKDNHIGEK